MTALFTPSPHQLAIRHEVQHGSGSLIVEAVAGSGKTTTIVWVLDAIPSHNTVLFLAFNKSIAETLKEKVPQNCVASTFHALGFSALKRANRGIKVEQHKVDNILRKQLNKEHYEMYGTFVRRLISFAKGAVGIGTVPDAADWQDIIQAQEMYLEDERAEVSVAIQYAQVALTESNSQDSLVDFDDMLYLPLLRRLPFTPYDYVFVDEAQDTNAIQREILTKCKKPNGRLIAVGDSSQAIYAFRGADSDAMRLLKDRFNCKALPLSVCYRCAESIVRASQRYQAPSLSTSQITWREGALPGTVKHLDGYMQPQFSKPCAILCRNKAPLLSFAFALLKRSISCRVLGREIGEELIRLVQKHSGPDGDACGIEPLLTSFDSWVEREAAKFTAKEMWNQLEVLQEKHECIHIVAENVGTDKYAGDLCDAINRLFNPPTGSSTVTLATIHKAKGLEWTIVHILDADKLMPSKFAKRPHQLRQEDNLHYVAITRAREELYYIKSGTWKHTQNEQTQQRPASEAAI